MVKLRVNLDSRTTYHLYYVDEIGRPASILTFFPWPIAPKGYRGTDQVLARTSFLITEDTIVYWMERFKHQDIYFIGAVKRSDKMVITVYHPDAFEWELVAHKLSRRTKTYSLKKKSFC